MLHLILYHQKPNVKPPVTEGGSPASKNVTVKADDDDGNSDYQAAFGMFKIGKFKAFHFQISKVLSRIILTSEFVPSSHYWIGNSYYAMREFKNAQLDAAAKID